MLEPGLQGEVVTGTHGCGVGTPFAAAVAAATWGLAWVRHIPKGGMFTCGWKSFTVASACSSAEAFARGGTTREAGAAPWSQVVIAPWTTSFGMQQG
jgi:hypothetical protein